MNGNDFSISQSIRNKFIGATIIGALTLTVTAVVSPERAWANLLLAAFYLITLGLGGAVFIALTTVCGAGWNAAFRRVPEAMTGLLPIAGLMMLIAVTIHLPQYGWHHHGHGDAGTFAFKEFWLQPTFLGIRAVVYIVLWNFFGKVLVDRSRRQDKKPINPNRSINTMTSVLFLFVFGLTLSSAGIDWIMALEPMWFSTMWGVYQFSGLIMSTLAAIIIACIMLRRWGPLNGLFREDHLHDLGKLLFGFSCFWMYIWFSQYMLIWYSNIPEEISYFIPRTQGSWGPVVIGCIVVNWIIPFFVLLRRPCKRSEGVMLKVAVLILIGRWIDLYIMIFPPVTGDVPVFGLPEIATFASIFGIAGLVFFRSFASAPAYPKNEPFLQESLNYHG